MKKLQERLALLEHRMALLESQKVVASERTAVEELFVNLGLVYTLTHAHNRLFYEPRFTGYDDFLANIFKCTVNGTTRSEYAQKLKELSDKILDKANEDYQKSKKLNGEEI